ncbi:hypothetical protein HYY75_07130, partial [bacterium]|nr:hypothetical protein [bacterium]
MEDTLLSNLEAPFKSFRLLALENIIREGASQEILDALHARELEEKDDECRLLLYHAISSIKQRLQGPPPESLDSQGEENFLTYYTESGDEKKIQLLSNLSRPNAQKLSIHAPDWLEKETNAVVESALIWAFGCSWPEGRIDVLAKRLTSKSLSVRVASLEALVKLAPKALERQLPKLLVSSDSRIRMLAIRG